jgi:hypothetical protein
MSIDIARSALVSEGAARLSVAGPGQGRKVCGHCRTINIGARRHNCVKCGEGFYTEEAKPVYKKRAVAETVKPTPQPIKVKRTSKATLLVKIARLQAELGMAIAELASV